MKELLSEEFAGKLESLAKEKAEQYKNAQPFPHIYFDDFLYATTLEEIEIQKPSTAKSKR